MNARSATGLVILGLLCPAAAWSEGPGIEHKAVGCIVAGKYPKMNACFTPVSNLARARVYFRPEGSLSWYYVEMASDAPCHTGILPRPSKRLIDKHVEYYVEAQDKSFNPARTAEYRPIVVRAERDCKRDVLAAPFLNKATVAVFPGVPALFETGGAVGVGTVLLGVAGAGAAAVGVAVATGGDDATTTTSQPVAGGPSTVATTQPATTTTTTSTTLPAGANQPPFPVLTTKPDPPQGLSPLTVTFDMCKSTDPDGDPLSFFFTYGDGVSGPVGCVETHTYTASSFRAGAASTSFEFVGCVTDGFPGHERCRSRTVTATLPAGPSPSPSATTCPTPAVTLINPPSGTCYTSTSAPTNATATGSDQVTFSATEIDCASSGVLKVDDSKVVTGPGPGYATTLTLNPPATLPLGGSCYDIKAVAAISCSQLTASDVHCVRFLPSGPCFPCSPLTVPQGPSTAFLTVGSDLDLPGGRLQVVVNGSSGSYAAHGRSTATAAQKPGENRLEAVLVEGDRPGTWRVELPAGVVRPGSLRAIAGEVALVTDNAVVFRLKGIPGERVLLTFETR